MPILHMVGAYEFVFLCLCGVSVALAISVETFGSLLRAEGAACNIPTIGYSAHVRIATLGRIFIISAAPAVGYFVDKYKLISIVLIIGIVCFIVAITLHILMLISKTVNENIPRYIFSFFDRERLHVDRRKYKILEYKFRWVVLFGSMLTICLQTIGLFVVNALATMKPEYRATIIQTSGMITFLGTSAHIFIVDPILASDCDKTLYFKNTINNYIMGRLLGLVINFILFLFTFYVVRTS